MATAAPSQTALLDLTFLTEEERAQIEAVLRADEELRVRDRVRIGSLRQDLERERYHQKQLVDQRQCTHCERQLGLIFNSGAHCPGCLFRVCKQCRVTSTKPPPPFLCLVCVKKRLLDIQAADYIPGVQNTLSVPLYGSELVMKSLQAAHKNQPHVHNPYDSNFRRLSAPKVRSSTATSNSSIVVQYIEVERSGETALDEVRGEEEVSGGRERPGSLFARKLSPSEFSESEEGTEEEEEGKGGLSVPGRLKHSDSQSSIGSLASMYSAPGGKGDYQITGKVLFGVCYSREGILKIHVNQAKNLAATRKEGYSYPYVKVYLLPDRSKATKRKTGFVRRTVDPQYDETLKYKMPQSELSSRTLWLSVWDWDRFGRNQFLGEVRLPLRQLDLADNSDRWYNLQEMDDAANQESEVQYRGRLKVGLKFEWEEDTLPPVPGRVRRRKRKGALHVVIKQAEDLPKMDSLGLTDAAVKCYLLPSRTSSSKRKTIVVKNTVNPVWNEEFVYKCSQKELTKSRVLEVTVWDFDKRGSNEFIGGLHLGPAPGQLPHPKEWMDSFGEEVSHWEAMLSCPGEWVEQWHTLRPKMDHVTSLPQKPVAAGRELSPVQEKSPPVETEEGAGKGVSPQRGASPVPQLEVTPPSSPVQHARSLSLEKSRPAQPLVATPQATPPGPPQSKHTVPPPQATPTAPPHDLPLSQVQPIVEKQRVKSPPSPIPELLVTPDSPTLAPRSSSFGSQVSLYSVGEMGKGNYEITGEVLMGVRYREGQLLVHIDRARNLAAADSNGFSDPYVKTYLLPDKSKHSKRKTDIQKKTLNPMYNQTLKYAAAESELSSRTLWLSVWDWDRFGRNQFLGEVRLPLKSLNLKDSTDVWYSLQEKREPSPPPNPNCGELEVGLKFVPKETTKGVTSGSLSVLVKRACNLSCPEGSEKPDSFVKLYLLPEKSSAGRRKTSIIKNSSSPSWEERFIFEKVILEEVVKERVLEVTVWDHGDGSSSEFIGGLRIGPAPGRSSHPKEWMDSSGVEVTHWESMLSRPGEWTEQWHTLRQSMEPQKVDLSTSRKDDSAAAEAGSMDEFRKVVTKPGTDGAKETAAHQSTAIAAKVQGSPVTSVRSHRSPLPPVSSPSLNEYEQPSPRVQNSDTEPPLLIRRSSPVITQAPIKRTMSPLLDSVQASKARKPVKNEPAPSPPSSPPHRTAESPVTSVRSFPSKSSVPLSSPLPTSETVVSKPHAPPISEAIVPQEHLSHQAPPAAAPKKSGLLGLTHGDSQHSFGSQLSIYSAAGGGKGNYEITGEVLMGVRYREGQLLVHIDRARNLAAADSNGFSDPYVKTYLLPDKSKHSKRKTDIQRKTLNPVYNQTLVYKIPQSELSSRTLWLSVWDWDRFGRNQFLGEFRLALDSLDFTDTSDQWHVLLDKDEDPEGEEFYRGQLKLSLRFSPTDTKKGKTRGNLQIIIKQGRDLPSMDGAGGHPDPVVKCYLLPDKSSGGKRKVGVVKNNSNPVWEEQISYKVNLEEIVKERVLEVTVWDWDKKGSSFIGGLRLGPPQNRSAHPKEWMDSIGEEMVHWETMLARPGEWVEQWHTLRTTMDPRNVAIL